MLYGQSGNEPSKANTRMIKSTVRSMVPSRGSTSNVQGNSIVPGLYRLDKGNAQLGMLAPHQVGAALGQSDPQGLADDGLQQMAAMRGVVVVKSPASAWLHWPRKGHWTPAN